jgi:hypothetical protein
MDCIYYIVQCVSIRGWHDRREFRGWGVPGAGCHGVTQSSVGASSGAVEIAGLFRQARPGPDADGQAWPLSGSSRVSSECTRRMTMPVLMKESATLKAGQ